MLLKKKKNSECKATWNRVCSHGANSTSNVLDKAFILVNVPEFGPQDLVFWITGCPQKELSAAEVGARIHTPVLEQLPVPWFLDKEIVHV
jgi:hypothetical protein